MARTVFFSFHYEPDIQRAHVVRNSWVTKKDREQAGFFDSSVFEAKKRTSDDAIATFLKAGLHGASVTCVLTGAQTAYREWVRYEILQSFKDGRGLINVAIHTISNLKGLKTTAGANPFSLLGGEVKGDTLHFKEYNGSKWIWTSRVKSMPLAEVAYDLGGRSNFTFDQLFPSFDWSSDCGYDNLGTWVEGAAQAAGR